MLGQVVFASTALGLFAVVAIGVVAYLNYQQQQQQQQPNRAGGLGRRRYYIRSDEWNGTNPLDSAPCSICQDEISEKQRYTLSCKHSFHEECIMAWAQKKPECPNCRKAL
uniref:Putative e3 ubiquitin-protein ligase rnf43 n=1 Tax=Anopheles marajoara TaxID=58244 RepID=A0A2M4C455_9DIPT